MIMMMQDQQQHGVTWQTSFLPEKPRYKHIMSKRRGYKLGLMIDNVFKLRVELIMVKWKQVFYAV